MEARHPALQQVCRSDSISFEPIVQYKIIYLYGRLFFSKAMTVFIEATVLSHFINVCTIL